MERGLRARATRPRRAFVSLRGRAAFARLRALCRALLVALLSLAAFPCVAADPPAGAPPDAAGESPAPAAPAVLPAPPAAPSGPTLGDYYRDREEKLAGEGSSAGAANPPPAAASPAGAEPREASLIARYFRALGWVVAALVVAGAAYAAYRTFGKRRASIRGGRLVEVVARTALTPRHQLVVVRVSERVLVLGVSPDRIATLAELTDPRDAMRAGRGAAFSERLLHAENGGTDVADLADAADPYAEAAESTLEPYRREIERLKTMVGNWRLAASRKEGV